MTADGGLVVTAFVVGAVLAYPVELNAVRVFDRYPGHRDGTDRVRPAAPLVRRVLRSPDLGTGRASTVWFPLFQLGFGVVPAALLARSAPLPAVIRGTVLAAFVLTLALTSLEIGAPSWPLPYVVAAPGVAVGLVTSILPRSDLCRGPVSGWLAAQVHGLVQGAPGELAAAVLLALAGAAVGQSTRLLNIVYPAGWGYGIVRAMAMVGAFLGPDGAALAIFVSFLSGVVVGVVQLATGRVSPHMSIPYAPHLAVGAIVTLLAGPS